MQRRGNMALSLRNIYEQTSSKYHLKLLCGESNLDNIMNWVYISEDISTGEFLQGGELIITTGISSSQSPTWLYDFISNMIHHNTCGMILNIGVYINESHITSDIIKLCKKHNYPLFTMPWETRIYDITHDYYNRIFQDTQTDATITNAFQNLLHKRDLEQNLEILSQYGCRENQNYTIVYLQYHFDDDPSNTRNYTLMRLRFFLEQQLKKILPEFYLCHGSDHYFIVVPITPLEKLHQDILNFTNKLFAQFPYIEFRIGLGNQVLSLTKISSSFFNAKAAASMAVFTKQTFYSFKDMGFFKLLVNIEDKHILDDYLQEHLGSILKYDAEHNSNYTETLYQYLLCDGSVKKIAENLFCHRNTINYRIHIIKETLSYNLDDSKKRFELMTAFQIMEYLKI